MDSINRRSIFRPYRPVVRVAFLVFATAFGLMGWNTVARLQSNETSEKQQNPQRPVTVSAEKRGFPHISLADGTDLVVDGAQDSDSPGKLLASADFDSDGTADLIVADQGGTVRLFHGIPEAKRSLIRKAEGLASPEPFVATAVSVPLGISPDFLATGDFNADGHKDILAASKGSAALVLVTGAGNGSFAEPKPIAVDGRITAFAVGEIGLSDGQTDLAIAVTGRSGSHLLVFEHPESAFKYKPEIIDLPSPAVTIAIGDLNGDHYSDIAVGGGTTLTIVSERGQTYPWDMLKGSGITRPGALVEKRQMPLPIADLVVGTFGGERENSLAVLSASGTVMRLKPTPPAIEKRAPSLRSNEVRSIPRFLPVDVAPLDVNTLADQFTNLAAADPSGSMLVDSRASAAEKQTAIDKKFVDDARQDASLSPTERDAKRSEILNSVSQKSGRAKAAFMREISARPSNVAKWGLETLVNDARLAASATGPGEKMIRGRVSLSGTDDLIFPASTGNQLNIVAFPTMETGLRQAEVISLDAASSPTAVLPMSLNGDGLDELVILRSGMAVPTIVPTAPTTILIVNSSDDISTACDGNGPCSLRSAIELANLQPGTFIAILFDTPGVHTILPLTQLPIVRGTGTYIAGGISNADGSKLVEISGTLAGQADGIKVRSSDCVVQDLVINDFHGITSPDGSTTGGNSITVESTALSPNNAHNLIVTNYLGTDVTGSFAKGSGTGVLVFDSDSNSIVANVMSGNGTQTSFGLGLDITGGNSNEIRGNLIGTTANGNAKLANSEGVFLTGSNNQFGGDAPGDGNTVSGNGSERQPGNPAGPGCDGPGVVVVPLFNLDTGESLTLYNTFKGNKMGTSSDGLNPLGNCYHAIRTVPQTATTIGSITLAGRNVISDNSLDAIWCGFAGLAYDDRGYCHIAGNNIGTDITGTVAMPNTIDNVTPGPGFSTATVLIVNSDSFSYFGSPGGTTPGGACTGFCNLLSGQYTIARFGNGSAFSRYGWGTVGAFNNYVGTNLSGTAGMANFNAIGMGAALYDPTVSYIGGYGTDGNGAPVEFGNLLSGNKGDGANCGAYIYAPTTCLIQNNLVGTDLTGTTAIPNAEFNESGVRSVNGYGTTLIGGPDPLARNVIAGNHNAGIAMRNAGGTLTVSNNYIGVSKSGGALSNEVNGVVDFYGGATIGGSQADSNLIAYNTGAGILLSTAYGPDFISHGVDISQNSIHGNTGLGIDIQRSGVSATGDGVNPNDCQDSDIGSNDRQNFPVLFAPTYNGTVTVDGVLSSVPGQAYRIDVYANISGDPSEYGEGGTFIGSKTVTTNGNGSASFTFTSSGAVPNGAPITATATDPYGQTSEFSCIAGGACTLGLTAEQFVDSPSVTCSEPIKVNVTTDEPDADIGDGVCDVDTGNSGLQCSLRAAIQEANARAGFDVIEFEIPGSGVQTIAVATELPPVTGPVTLRGDTQPGYSHTPLIVVTSPNSSVNYGLKFMSGSDGSTVNALTINSFYLSGLYLASGGNSVRGSFIGMNPDGVTFDPAHRQGTGIEVIGSNNKIGSDLDANAGNVISGNAIGIMLNNSSGNSIRNNKIGVDRQAETILAGDQTALFGNLVGVQIYGTNNSIGGDDGEPAARNIISKNSDAGIALFGNGNRIFGNYIGTNGAGALSAPNGSGIVLNGGASGNEIGGTGTKGNVISGHKGSPQAAGINITQFAGPGNLILGNVIGLDPNGQLPSDLANSFGIIVSAGSNTIGSESAPNIICHNENFGVIVDGGNAGISGVSITGNYIGVNASSQVFRNGFGVVLNNNVQSTRISKNVISGHQNFGVVIANGSTNNLLTGNKIGTDAAGSSAIGNVGGVIIFRASSNTVSDNLISGNDIGITIGDGQVTLNRVAGSPSDRPTDSIYATDNMVQRNLIGTNADGESAIPNRLSGVALIENAKNNLIGGSIAAGQGNTISGNNTTGSIEGNGVFIASIHDSVPIESLPTDNKIQGNRIGIKKNSDVVLGNTTAVFVLDALNNLIGGDTSDLGNLIGGSSGNGIVIRGARSAGNMIRNNFIGTTSTALPISNQADGIYVGENAAQTEISSNTIGGNGENGINIENIDATPQPRVPNSPASPPYPGVRASGNYICVELSNSPDAVKVPNGQAGIRVSNSVNIAIGAGTDIAKNIISGCNGSGLLITGNSSMVSVKNSVIGTSPTGQVGIGNLGDGITITNSATNEIGGNRTTEGNIIAGNVSSGLRVSGNGSIGNLIRGNRFGTASQPRPGHLLAPGDSPIGNGEYGVLIDDAPGNEIGGDDPNYGNYFANQTLDGIKILSPGDSISSTTFITGNQITLSGGAGIDLSAHEVAHIVQNSITGNALGGAILSESSENLVKDNTVSQNGTVGISLSGVASAGNTVSGNTVSANTGPGVLITDGATQNMIGGPASDSGNNIYGNQGPGVRIDDSAGNSNTVDPNSIYGNTGLGIDIGPLGLNPNDADDLDISSGGNRLQNYPDIAWFGIDANGDLIVEYNVDSATNISEPGASNYGQTGLRIEFFTADAAGQGREFLGADYFTATDHNALVRRRRTSNRPNAPTAVKSANLGNAVALGFGPGDRVTGTATDADGNTSEFFPPFAPTAAGVTVSGRVEFADGRPVGQVVVRISNASGEAKMALTNAFGYYRLDDIEVGGTYVISASGKNVHFTQESRLLIVDDEISDVDFTAIE